MVFSAVGLIVLACPFSASLAADSRTQRACTADRLSHGLIPFTVLFVLQRVSTRWMTRARPSSCSCSSPPCSWPAFSASPCSRAPGRCGRGRHDEHLGHARHHQQQQDRAASPARRHRRALDPRLDSLHCGRPGRRAPRRVGPTGKLSRVIAAGTWTARATWCRWNWRCPPSTWSSSHAQPQIWQPSPPRFSAELPPSIVRSSRLCGALRTPVVQE